MFRFALRKLQAAAPPTSALPGATPAAQSTQRRQWFHGDIITKKMGSYKDFWVNGMGRPNTTIPLQQEAMLHCVDNTNVKHIRLLTQQLAYEFQHYRVTPASTHRVSLIRFAAGKEALPRQKIRPGTLYWVLLFSRRQEFGRYSGLGTKFDRTTAVLINEKRVPIGTRVMYCSGRHVNHKLHLKAAVLANFFI